MSFNAATAETFCQHEARDGYFSSGAIRSHFAAPGEALDWLTAEPFIGARWGPEKPLASSDAHWSGGVSPESPE